MTLPKIYMKAFILAVLVIITLGKQGNAQLYNPRQFWYIGPQIGVVSFFGDLSVYDFDPSMKLSEESGFAYSLRAGKAINGFSDAHMELTKGSMKGANPGLDMIFSNNFTEFTLGVSLSINHFIWKESKSRFNVTANAGTGIIRYRAIKYHISDGSFISSEGYTPQKTNSGPAKTSIVFPLGVGLTYRLSNHLNLNGDVSFRFQNKDVLDSQVGETGVNDRYSYISLGLFYIINPIIIRTYQPFECPEW